MEVGSAIGGILFLLLLAGASVFWIWALVDAIRQPEEQLRSGSRLIWVVVVAVTHFVGGVLYVLFGRPSSRRAVA